MKRFLFLSVVGLGYVIGVSTLSTPALAVTCASLMKDSEGFGKTYCCTFKSQNNTITGNALVNAEFPSSVVGADFNITGPFRGTGPGLTDLGCSCQATGTIANPNFDNSTSFICAGPDSGTLAGGAGGAVGFQNHTAIVGKATATTLKGQMLFNSNSETPGQLYDSVVFSCTTRLTGCPVR